MAHYSALLSLRCNLARVACTRASSGSDVYSNLRQPSANGGKMKQREPECLDKAIYPDSIEGRGRPPRAHKPSVAAITSSSAFMWDPGGNIHGFLLMERISID